MKRTMLFGGLMAVAVMLTVSLNDASAFGRKCKQCDGGRVHLFKGKLFHGHRHHADASGCVECDASQAAVPSRTVYLWNINGQWLPGTTYQEAFANSNMKIRTSGFQPEQPRQVFPPGTLWIADENGVLRPAPNVPKGKKIE